MSMNLTPQQMMSILTGMGSSQAPMVPMARSTVPGIIPPAGQGSPKPGLQVQQILQLMAAPKLQGKVR